MEDLELIFDVAKESMDGALKHLASELLKIRAGRANPVMLDGVFVEYYGSNVPIQQVANVNTPDARTITVQPWEKNMLSVIEKAIINSNLGLNPQNNGEIIIINVPPLTEERRLNLVKQSKAEAETARVSIRNARKDANDSIRKLKGQGISEDILKDAEDTVQKFTDTYVKKVEEQLEEKEKEIMKV